MQTIEKTAQCGNSRRGFLRHLAVAPALAAGALPAAGGPSGRRRTFRSGTFADSPESASSGIHALINAHKLAWQALELASVAYMEASDAAEEVLVRSARGAYKLGMGREKILARIADDYAYALDGLRASVGRLVPDHQLATLELAIERRKVENLAEAERLFEEAHSSPEAVAERAWEEAAEVEGSAYKAVLAYPCRSIDDVTEKAGYLVTTDWFRHGLNEAEVEMLVRSAVAVAV